MFMLLYNLSVYDQMYFVNVQAKAIISLVEVYLQNPLVLHSVCLKSCSCENDKQTILMHCLLIQFQLSSTVLAACPSDTPGRINWKAVWLKCCVARVECMTFCICHVNTFVTTNVNTEYHVNRCDSIIMGIEFLISLRGMLISWVCGVQWSCES